MTDARFQVLMIGITAILGTVGTMFTTYFSYRAQRLGQENKAKLNEVGMNVDGQAARTDKHMTEITKLVSTAITGTREDVITRDEGERR